MVAMPFYSASLIETVQVSYFLLSLLVFFFGIFNVVCISDCVTEQFKQCPFKFFISQMPHIYSRRHCWWVYCLSKLTSHFLVWNLFVPPIGSYILHSGILELSFWFTMSEYKEFVGFFTFLNLNAQLKWFWHIIGQ